MRKYNLEWWQLLSLLKFPFHNHVHVFLCTILPVWHLKYPLSCFLPIYYYYYYYFTPCEFFLPALSGGLLLKTDWLQVSSCLQDSSQNFQLIVVWMILILPLIPNSCSLFFQDSWDFSSTQIAICIIVTVMLYIFFTSLARLKYLSIFLISFIFTL